MRKRNWLVEDNLVALYIALYEYKDLNYELKEIEKIIPHKSFLMRVQNYIAIDTNGVKGLDAALESPLFNGLYDIFKGFSQKKFARLVNSILDVKSKVKKNKAKTSEALDRLLELHKLQGVLLAQLKKEL